MKKRKDTWTDVALVAIAVLLLLIVLVFSMWRAQARGIGETEVTAPTDWTQHQVNAHRIAEHLRTLGYEEDNVVIRACQEWWRAEKDNPTEPEQIEYTTAQQRWEHPEAAYAWQRLREAGFDAAHAAAILGNAMSESGGQTFSIDFYQDVAGCWGAWAMSKQFFPDVVGKGADDQIAKIVETLDSNMRVAGGSAAEFLAITDVRAAAKYFSDFWERPAVYNQERATNAELALEYFGG